MTTANTTDLAASLATVSARAENWRILCERYSLAQDASPAALETAIRQRGYAEAVTDVQIFASDLAANAKRYTKVTH